MNVNRTFLSGLLLAVIGILCQLEVARAQPFGYTNNDLLLGFRKTGVFQENYEVVVNVGKGINYVGLGQGTTIPVPNFTPSQLTPGSFSSLNNLNWAVFGCVLTNLTSTLPGYVNNTLWVTVPRADVSVQSTPPTRLSYAAQGQGAAQNIKSIGGNARFLSSQTASNQYNTAKFVREPVNDPANLSAFIAGLASSSDSTFRDTWTPNAENTTPANFTGSVVSDLYEVMPTNNQSGAPVTDPHTHLTSGPAYYVGYFRFGSDGTMTFTRGSSTNPPPPPPPPQLSASRSGSVTTISFTTTNGATYTLYYTNSAGLSQPVRAWPSLPNTVAGDGSTKTFNDNSADQERFYRVGAQ
jgi:hypothetical protein